MGLLPDGLKQKTKDFIQERITDAGALRAFAAERRIRRSGPIRVGFLCQFIPAWAKMETLYRLMQADERFEPYLICVPSNIQNCRLTAPESMLNDTYQYFLDRGYAEARNALIGPEQWLDLRELGLSYVFYTRPYNTFMPEPYTSSAVSKFSRVCMLMYSMNFAVEDCGIALNRQFMSRVYFYFAETDYARQLHIRQNRLAHRLGLQKTLCVGLPALDTLAAAKEQASSSWDFSKNGFRVMWTPRWTTDPTAGGSNFFTYGAHMLRLAREHPDIDFLLRPHPLMFSHFIETGEMTAQEAESYQAECASMTNVALDKQSQYDATLWGTDVLISDISGIVPEFLFTGKPVIFCATNMQLELLEPMKKLLTGCYTVHDSQELTQRLLDLQAGNDPLRQQRLQAVREVFGEGSPSRKILELLAQDRKA